MLIGVFLHAELIPEMKTVQNLRFSCKMQKKKKKIEK